MKRKSKAMIISLFVSTCLLWVAVVNGFGEEYEVLKGLKSVKAAFDVRAGNPKSAALTLKVIHQTYQDENVTAVTKNPAFTVVFIGPSVKLISKNREGYSPEENKILDGLPVPFHKCQRRDKVRDLLIVAWFWSDSHRFC
jgi:hypothetical protein